MGAYLTTLHLGVLDQPYDNEKKPMTTYQVAEFLEEKYGIMQAWWDNHGEEVAEKMEVGVQSAIDAVMENRRQANDPFGSAMNFAEHSFKNFLSSMEAERVGIPGTPTKAALRGVRHRKKGYKAVIGPRRPSFIDSGMYEANFKAWIDAWLK